MNCGILQMIVDIPKVCKGCALVVAAVAGESSPRKDVQSCWISTRRPFKMLEELEKKQKTN